MPGTYRNIRGRATYRYNTSTSPLNREKTAEWIQTTERISSNLHKWGS